MLDRVQWLRVAPLAVALIAIAPLQACFGKFALTHTLYNINKGVSDSYVVQEIVFLLFALLQVYTVTGFIDAFILNLIEVITGENPVQVSGLDVGESREVALKGGETLILTRIGDGLRIEQIGPDGHKVYALREGERGMEVSDETGKVLAGTVRLDDGSFQVIDGEGRVLAHPGTSILAQMGDALLRRDADAVVALATAEAGPEACLLAY